MRFDTTRWSMVLQARDGSDHVRPALEGLCRTYRPPVLAYIRRRGYDTETAEDLTQTFFAQFLEYAYHADADPVRGKFRAFLLTALKRFLIDADNAAQTVKRGGQIQFQSLDQLVASGDSLDDLVDAETPESAFERSWAAALIDAAITRLRAEAVAAGKQAMFAQLCEFVTERPDEADYARVCAALNLHRNTLAVAVHRLRQRFRELIGEELAETVTSATDLAAEQTALHTVLRESQTRQ